MRLRLTIGHKILLAIGLVSAVILTGISSFYLEHERKNILRQNQRARTEQVQGVVNGLKAIMIPGFASIAQSYAEQLRKVPGMVDFRIMRLDGRQAFLDNETIEDVNWRRGKDIFPLQEERGKRHQILSKNNPNLVRALAEKRQVFYEERGEENELLQTILIPIVNERECHLCHDPDQPLRGVVKMTTSLAQVDEAIADAQRRAGMILLTSLTLLLMVVFVLIRRSVIKPIQEVERAMSRVAAGDLSFQVPVVSHDELGDMAKNFNIMVDQLLRTYTGFQAERNKLSTIILSAREGIIVTDQHEHIVLVNPAAERFLGKTSEQIVQGGFLHFMDDPDYVQQLVVSGGAGMPETVVYNQLVLSIHAARICSPGGDVIGSAALIRDVTEEKKLEEKLRHLSYTDKLTGLFNRRRMEELMAVEFDRAQRYGLSLSYLLLDVDHFKRFNDQHGHDMGDRVLQMVGRCMLNFFRKSDFPCRYGGEEFCVILTNIPNTANDRGFCQVAERLRKTIEEMVIDGLQVTVSIGVSIMTNREFPDVPSMIKAADNALYRAKKLGRNRVVLANTLDTQSEEENKTG
ncbi:MAG: diguanylate cyclase [Magnetococcales bacterium]|nr:diguanylate cyclase [Magnetococcales bacterium]